MRGGCAFARGQISHELIIHIAKLDDTLDGSASTSSDFSHSCTFSLFAQVVSNSEISASSPTQMKLMEFHLWY